MRLYRLSFIAGFAAGFVAGTRAGREKYDQMVKLAKTAAENPTVQQAAGAIQAQASTLASTTAQKVGGQLHDKVPQMAHNAAHTVGERIPGFKHRNSAATRRAAAGDGHPFTAPN
jgi:BRCT domain type II-containing protein